MQRLALSLLFVSLAIAPDDFRIALLERWVYSFSDGRYSYSAAAVLSSGRAFFTPLILCWIGVFLGFIRILILKLKTIKRLASTLLLIITSAAFVVNFARGPIVAIFIVFILLAIMVFGFKREQIIRGVTIFVAFIVMLSTGYIVTVTYLPIALTKWDMDGMTFEQAIDPVRIEQTEVMLNAWLEEPILGQGVGNIISGYARDESGLAFEVQYPMILYRTGIVGFCFIMTPFLWIMVRTVRRIKQIPELLNTDKGKLLLTMACSVGAILVASWTNPLFSVVYDIDFCCSFFCGRLFIANNEVTKAVDPDVWTA